MPGLLTWLRRRSLTVWHHAAYRLPIPSLEGVSGVEPRRADHVASLLLDVGAIPLQELRAPDRIGYRALRRVHSAQLLESLSDPEQLARIFASDPSDLQADEIMNTVRLACGGTLAAARFALARHRPTLNLLGGFHHAGISVGGGFCPVNDIAVAVAALRAEGFRGRVVVLDLDAHPPDGTAECLAADPGVWIGSISGCDWGPLDGDVDETVLATGASDETYLAVLSSLLRRMPPAELMFVMAGGDVLAEDRMGGLGVSLEGARERDRRIAEAVHHCPSVWLPGGGYSSNAWRVLAHTGLELSLGKAGQIPADYNPLRSEYHRVARSLSNERLQGEIELSEADLMGDLWGKPAHPRFLGFYTKEGIELALERYGILDHLERIGYRNFRVELDPSTGSGERMRIFGRAAGREHLLVEAVLEAERVPKLLYVNWLTLMNPRGKFSERRPALPGQEHPGLGLARESGELLLLMAERLGLEGVAFRPASYHLAYAGRHDCHFVDPTRQGRFEAMVRDLSHLPLLQASSAVAAGKVLLNGEPYTWEADLMVRWLEQPTVTAPGVAEAKDASHFELQGV